MINHVPDLERCKRLMEMGFPQETEFYWATDNADAFWIVHKSSHDYMWQDTPYAAPIVTELLAEIRRFLPSGENDAIVDVLVMALYGDGTWDINSMTYVDHHADTLPNALSDLWCWLRERAT